MKRPFGVWLIAIYAAWTTIVASYGFFLLFTRTGPYTSQANFGTVTLLDYALSILYAASFAAGAVYLFLLRATAFRLFVAAAAFKFLIISWQLLTHRFLAGAAGHSPPVLIAFALSWVIILAIIFYASHLSKKNILR